MTVKELIEEMKLEIVAGEENIDNVIKGGYVGDLLSFVMSHAKEGNLWITIQGHINSIAVATLLGMSAIVLTEGSVLTEDAHKKANDEGIPVLSTNLSSFDFISKYSDVEEQKIISNIFMNQDERYFDTALLNKMLLDNIKILNKNYIEMKLKTITDVKEIQNLLFKKKELDRLYIDFING
jgi:predicted transcriptional regulator